MSRCDFCEKEMIGSCSFECALYCEDHEKEALEVEKKMYEAMENHLDSGREI